MCVSIAQNARQILFYSLPGSLDISCVEGYEDLVEVSQ